MLQKLQNRKMAAFISSRCIEFFDSATLRIARLLHSRVQIYYIEHCVLHLYYGCSIIAIV